MKQKQTATVLSQKEIAPRIFDMWIATELAACAKAGQFIGVYPKDRSTLLPRPISICQVNDKKDALRIVYRIAGQGTAEFSSYQEGDGVEILGTLGNGFPTETAEGKKVFLMGGGIGIPPMLELSRELPASAEKQIIVGYRDDQLFLKEDLEKNGTVYIATEDGSVGTKGNVINALALSVLFYRAILQSNLHVFLHSAALYAAFSSFLDNATHQKAPCNISIARDVSYHERGSTLFASGSTSRSALCHLHLLVTGATGLY